MGDCISGQAGRIEAAADAERKVGILIDAKHYVTFGIAECNQFTLA